MRHVIKIKEGDNEDEFILVKHEKFKPALNVLSIYGEQEGRSQKAEIFEKWSKILDVIYSVLARVECLIVLGDINKHIGSDLLGVFGNHEKISYGGSLVRDLIEAGDLILVNNTEKSEGVPFTRLDPNVGT